MNTAQPRMTVPASGTPSTPDVAPRHTDQAARKRRAFQAGDQAWETFVAGDGRNVRLISANELELYKLLVRLAKDADSCIVGVTFLCQKMACCTRTLTRYLQHLQAAQLISPESALGPSMGNVHIELSWRGAARAGRASRGAPDCCRCADPSGTARTSTTSTARGRGSTARGRCWCIGLCWQL